MVEPMIAFMTPSDAYLGALSVLLRNPDWTVSPRNRPCNEVMNWLFVVEQPYSGPIVTRSEERNKVLASYLEAEKKLYLSGELRAEIWAAEASAFWKNLADPEGNISSNYGWLIFHDRDLPGGRTPWEWAKKSILEDQDTRQAYLRFASNGHLWDGNKDQVCTMHQMFLVREGELHATTVMRSNDVVKGLAYDMPWFIYLLERMSQETGIPVGTYTHIAHSLHLYLRDRKLALEMLGETE